jgi:hypothetical protein
MKLKSISLLIVSLLTPGLIVSVHNSVQAYSTHTFGKATKITIPAISPELGQARTPRAPERGSPSSGRGTGTYFTGGLL